MICRATEMALAIGFTILSTLAGSHSAAAGTPKYSGGLLIADEWSSQLYVVDYPDSIDSPLAIPLRVNRVGMDGARSPLGTLVLDETCPPQEIQFFSSARVVYLVVRCENAFRDVARLFALRSGKKFKFIAELDHYSSSHFLPVKGGRIRIVSLLRRSRLDSEQHVEPWLDITCDDHRIFDIDTVRVQDSAIVAERGGFFPHAIAALPNGNLMALAVVGRPGLGIDVADTSEWLTYFCVSPDSGRITQRGTHRIDVVASTIVPLLENELVLGVVPLGRVHDESWFLVGGRGGHDNEPSHTVVGLVGFSYTGVLVQPPQTNWLDSLCTSYRPLPIMRSVTIFPRSRNWFRVIDVDTALQMTRREAYGK